MTAARRCEPRCDARREAQAKGEMFYSSRHGGWVFPAEDRMPPRVLREKAFAPFVWIHCPFCGGDLPDATSAVEPTVWRDADDGN